MRSTRVTIIAVMNERDQRHGLRLGRSETGSGLCRVRCRTDQAQTRVHDRGMPDCVIRHRTGFRMRSWPTTTKRRPTIWCSSRTIRRSFVSRGRCRQRRSQERVV